MIKKIVEKIILKGRKIPLFNFLYEKRFVHFFSIAVMGFLINIIITIGLTELILGRENYFFAYVVGISVNLLFNFIMHRKYTFKVKNKVVKRLFKFIITNLLVTLVNVILVKNIVKIIGNKWYWLTITGITVILFFVNFLVSKYKIFQKK